MLDIQELDARSSAMQIVRELDRGNFERIIVANQQLAEQNLRVLDVVDRWLAEQTVSDSAGSR